jgi:hypothetical protein
VSVALFIIKIIIIKKNKKKNQTLRIYLKGVDKNWPCGWGLVSENAKYLWREREIEDEENVQQKWLLKLSAHVGLE